ncbi:hypothetical protein ACOSQ2_005166 [Xanthoceras sorbifolium]
MSNKLYKKKLVIFCYYNKLFFKVELVTFSFFVPSASCSFSISLPKFSKTIHVSSCRIPVQEPLQLLVHSCTQSRLFPNQMQMEISSPRLLYVALLNNFHI